MKIKKLIQLKKRDNRKLGDIFQIAVSKTELPRFSSICGIDVNEETVSESKALKNAKPLTDISLREVPFCE